MGEEHLFPALRDHIDVRLVLLMQHYHAKELFLKLESILGWDSDSQTSQGASPGYFVGARLISTVTPISSPISPIAEENPAAPQSVIALIKFLSLASKRASAILFSSIAFPIWTDWAFTVIV